MTAAWVVLDKELRDALRDRRAIASLLLFPLLGPVLVAVALWVTTSQIAGEEGTKLPVSGAEHAPGLVSFLEDRGVVVEEPPEDVAGAVRDGDVEAVLVIPPDYAERHRAREPIALEFVRDTSRGSSRSLAGEVRSRLRAYGRTLGTLRALAQGHAPSVAHPLEVRRVDTATPERRAAVVLYMVPMFVLIAVFVGGMYVATDVTAGERERGSLEPLLLTPASRRSVVAGKWLVAAAFSAATALLTLVLSVVALEQVPIEELGITMSLGLVEMGLMLVAVVPLAPFVAALQLCVASFARSYKEAQTYLSFMMFLPMIPALLFGLQPIEPATWMYPAPVLGQQAVLMGVIRGETPGVAAYVLAAVGALVAAVALVLATARLLTSERVILGR